MRWKARVGDRLHEVDMKRGPDGTVLASVDGRAYELSVTEPQRHVFSFLAQGVSYEAFVQVRRGTCRVRIGPAVFDVVPDDPGLGGQNRARAGESVITAVMPGRVLRVLVEKGDAVEARQGLVVLEAMKMENEIGAPRQGTVREVKVRAGATVESGDPLVVLE